MADECWAVGTDSSRDDRADRHLARCLSRGAGRAAAVTVALAATIAVAACSTSLGSAAVADPTGVTNMGSEAALGTPTAPAPAAAVSPTVAEIARLTSVVGADPGNPDAQRQLGFALVQRVRETADPSLYAPAMSAFNAALAIEPEDAVAMVGVASVQLGKHEFATALQTARDAIDLSPTLVPAHAAQVDALVELGRYDEAEAAAGEMLALGVDLTTLARVSYIAELNGRLPEALAAMRLAAEAPGLAPENTAFARVLLGNLLVYSGEPGAADDAYAAALDLVPDHAPAHAGRGRLAVGSGQLADAIAHFKRAAAIVPLPEYVIALGDAQSASGDSAAAKRSYDLARAAIQLSEAAGVIVDVDLAVFEADHGDPADALEYATAAYESAATIRSADAVAWALHRLGRDREAATYAAESVRLGSIDPMIRYHAGAIAAATGDVLAARESLELALALDPGFSAVGAADARRLLATLP